MSLEGAKRMLRARVVKAYIKKSPKEISLLVGDELIVLDASNHAMWFGQIESRQDKKSEVQQKSLGSWAAQGNATGWFPATNVVPFDAPPLPTHPSNQSSKGGVRLSMRIDASTFRNQITSALGDPGIVIGTHFPGLPEPKMRKHARVLHDYVAESQNELTIKAGDIISILSSGEDESWWEGELQSGQIGYFPKDFVQVFRDPTADPRLIPATPRSNAPKIDCKEFDDPHAVAIIGQVIQAHEPVVPFNDQGLPFLALPAGAIVALLDSNPNHLYWLVVQFNDNIAPLPGLDVQVEIPPSSGLKSQKIGLVPKATIAVLEGLAEPCSNYPFDIVQLGSTRYLANRALGSVSTSDGSPACLARIAFEFHGENDNEHEYLGVGDLVWVVDDDDMIRSEPWAEVELETKRAFCPTSFLEILSDRVQAPKPGVVLEVDPVTGEERKSVYFAASPSPIQQATPAAATKLNGPPKSNLPPIPLPVQNVAPATEEYDQQPPEEWEDQASPSSPTELPVLSPRQTLASAVLARVLYPYNADTDFELTIKPGDIIRLIDYPPNEEWWEGILVAEDGTPLEEDYIGLFPRDFVVILDTSQNKNKRPKRGAGKSNRAKRSALMQDIENLSSQLDAAHAEIQAKNDEIYSLSTELQTATAELDLARATTQTKTLEAERYHSQLNAVNKEKHTLQQALNDLEKKLKSVSASADKAQQQQAENDQVKAELAKSNAHISSLEFTQTKLQEQITQLTKKLEDSHRAAVDKAKQPLHTNPSSSGPLPSSNAPAKASASRPTSGYYTAGSRPPSYYGNSKQNKISPSYGNLPSGTVPPPHTSSTPNLNHAGPPKTPIPQIPTSTSSGNLKAAPGIPKSGTPPMLRNLPHPPEPMNPKAAPVVPPFNLSTVSSPTTSSTTASASHVPTLQLISSNSQSHLQKPQMPRSAPPKQPAPSLPAEFVKKTAVPSNVGKVQGYMTARKAPPRTPISSDAPDGVGPAVATSSNGSPPNSAMPRNTPPETPPPDPLDAFASKRRFFENLRTAN